MAPFTPGGRPPGQSAGKGMGVPGCRGPGAGGAAGGGLPGQRRGRGHCHSHIRVPGSQIGDSQDGAPPLPNSAGGVLRADRAGPADGLRTSLAMRQRHWANQTATPPEGAGTVTVAAGVAATVGVGFRFRVGSGSPSRSGLASGSRSRSRAGPTLVRTRPEMLVTITGSVLYAMHYSFPSRLCITMWPRCSP